MSRCALWAVAVDLTNSGAVLWMSRDLVTRREREGSPAVVPSQVGSSNVMQKLMLHPSLLKLSKVSGTRRRSRMLEFDILGCVSFSIKEGSNPSWRHRLSDSCSRLSGTSTSAALCSCSCTQNLDLKAVSREMCGLNQGGIEVVCCRMKSPHVALNYARVESR